MQNNSQNTEKKFITEESNQIADKLINEFTAVVMENYQLKQYLHHVEDFKIANQQQITSFTSLRSYKLWQKILKFFAPIKKLRESVIQFLLDRELYLSTKHKSTNGLDIINFGVIPYEFRFQRPQHFVEELAKLGHRVFYIEPEFSRVDKATRNNLYPKINKIRRNIYKVALPSLGRLFIHHDKPSTEDQECLLYSLKALFHKANITAPVVKIDHPFWLYLIDKLNLPIVYDCMDDHSAFKVKTSEIDLLEKKLVQRSDLVIVSSRALEEKMKIYKPKKLVILKNAVEYELFKKAAEKTAQVPPELKNLPRPIIGYYGAICEWFDTEVLEKVARAYSSYSIVLIGNIDNPQVTELSKRYKNIYLLGEKPYKELFKYLQEFDVCLIPFLITDLIKATNPVKVYEYFAAGKPVVATCVPELRVFKNLLYISENSREFCQNVRRALEEKDDTLVVRRQQIAKENTWERRCLELEKALLHLK